MSKKVLEPRYSTDEKNVQVNNKVSFEMASSQKRASWDNKLQFILGVVSMAVGLGNVWRFPYLCQQNGGGAFLIPYIIMLFLAGLPLNLIELGIGQKMSQGSIGVWNTIHPFLGGLGICSMLVSFFIALYYNVVISWCFFYFFNSFQSTLPWSECPVINNTVIPECALSSSTAYFWFRKAIDTSPSISETGEIKWWMALCLLLSWVVIYLCMMRGIQSSGKVMYFTALFPYVVLAIFLIRAVTLEGADLGLKYLITPKLDRLADAQTWMDAATQVLYSMSLAFGGLIAYASYNPSDNDCKKDAVLTTIINLLTSLLTATVVFSVLGFKAMEGYRKCLNIQKNKLVDYFQLYPDESLVYFFNTTLINATAITDDDMIRFMEFNSTSPVYSAANITLCDKLEELKQAGEGTGLAFIVFTQAIIKLPGAPFWAVIFFLMLLALGIGSQFGTLESVITNIFDGLHSFRIRKELITGILCIICFFIDLIFVTGSGEYWVNLIDSFTANLGLIIIAFLEIIAVIYIYGSKRFCNDIETMTGSKPGYYWIFTWKICTPLVILVIFVASVIENVQKTRTYSAWNAREGKTESVPFPAWAQAIGYSSAAVTMLPLLLVFIVRLFGCFKVELNIHQASVKRIDTTVSTTAMIVDGDIANGTYENNGVVFPDGISAPKATFTMEIVD